MEWQIGLSKKYKECEVVKMAKGYRILAQGCQMSNDTRETGRNNNDLIIGPSGAGKTRGYVMPNILQGNESMIVADCKGNLRKQMGGVLKEQGFKVIQIDFTNCSLSYGYNPFDFIRYDKERQCYLEQDIMTVAASIVPQTRSISDPFWDLAARFYLESFIAYILECLPEREHSLDMAVRLFAEMGTGRFEKLMSELEELNTESFAVSRYNMYKGNEKAEKMHESIRGILAEKMSVFAFDGAKRMFHSKRRIDFAELGREKTAVFLNVSDTDRSMDKLVNLFYTQALQCLCYSADKNYNSKLKIPVRLILDDFAAGTLIPDFDKIISVIRSREIAVSIILQSISQLEGLYGHAKALTIINNCDSCLYLGGQDVETARYISTKANKSINSILDMPLDRAWLFVRGQEGRQVKRYDVKMHRKYSQLPECKMGG